MGTAARAFFEWNSNDTDNQYSPPIAHCSPVQKYSKAFKAPRISGRIISPIIAVLLWQLLSVVGLLPERILPAPTAIITAGWEVLTDGTLAIALATSGQRVITGFLIGVVAGIGLGLLVGMSSLFDAALDPLLQALRALPHLGLVPLFII